MGSTLGRIKLHDPKSRDFSYPIRRAVQGKSVRHSLLAPNVDQFYLSACVGFSGTNLLNTKPATKSRAMWNQKIKHSFQNRYLMHDDGIRNYSESTQRDPFEGQYPPDDEGSSSLGLMKYWTELGVITGYDWAFGFDQFLAALQRQPVLLGTDWYDGLGEPDSRGRVQISGQNVGGHEYLANAILWDQKLIGCEQSWGEQWGDHGKFFISWADMETLLNAGGDVAVPRLL